MSEAKITAAVTARLAAAGSTALSIGQLAAMTTKPEHYNQVAVSERLQPTRRVGGSGGVRLWRVSILSVGKRYSDTQNEREIARRTLEDQSLTVDGAETGALVSGIEDGLIVPDEGWFSGPTEFLLAH